ncbi:Structural maintenance of chromosomes protein 5 [Rhizophlyctis rosea]|uniref:Structural maintenance of chromosomes protein 5 n=1 Tax=Rhizophlyctis rosea TaxID=64517 RepID=A0AAD5SIS2_9FUNG|nr:Structural maintenance of chromosomes protein 5 [Rhizophlyctis rosea]
MEAHVILMQNVIVVGGASSGIDIMREVARVASTVYLSLKDPDSVGDIGESLETLATNSQDVWSSGSESSALARVLKKGVLKNFGADGRVDFEDGSIAEHVDAVIFATGYLYDFPYLHPDELSGGEWLFGTDSDGAGVTSTRKRHLREVEDEDDSPQTPSRPQRQTSTTESDSLEDDDVSVPKTQEDNADHTDGLQRPSPKRARVEASASVVEFQQGQIVRIRCHNFVTYDDVEVMPGPSLNMIIGPNGTGKSTLVCAIAIALGQSPKVVGRATEVSAYVKEGEEKGWVEIELKGRAKGRNIVIRRSIQREDNSTTYKLNGEPATEKAVKEKVQSLNIQVDNLCSFLPQDRVSEFAKMTSQQLLRATERAVGSVQMSAWHDQLIEIRQEEMAVQATIKTLAEDIDKLQQRTAATQRDVDRYNEREVLQNEIKKLEMKIAHQRFIERRDEFVVARDQKEAKKTAVVEILRELEPLQDECDGLQHQLEEAQQAVKRVNSSKRDLTAKLENAKTEYGTCETQGDDLQNQFTSIRKREQQRQSQLATLQKTITVMRADAERQKVRLITLGLLTEDGQASQDPSAYRGELASIMGTLREKNDILHRLREELEDCQAEQQTFFDESKVIRDRRAKLADEIQGLENVQNQKLGILERTDPNTFRATMWLRENKHRFKEKVYEPLVLEIGVKNPDYASAVESMLGGNTMMAFTVLCDEDYKLFGDEVMGKMNLRVNLMYLQGKKMNAFRRVLQQDEAQALGFDGTLIDVLEGPEDVLVVACNQHYIHNVPVTLKKIGNTDALEMNPKISQFVAGGMSYRVNRRYVDETRKHELENESEQQRKRLEELQKQTIDSRNRETKIRKEDTKIRAEKDDLVKQRKKLEKELAEYQRIQAQSGIKEASLNKIQQENVSIEQKEAEIKKAIHANGVKKAKIALDYHKIHARLWDATKAVIFAELNSVKYQADLLATKNKMRDLQHDQDVAQQEYDRAKYDFDQAKLVAREAKEEFNTMASTEGISEADCVAMMQELFPEASADDLEEIIEEKRTRVGLILAVDPAALERFEKDKRSTARKEAERNAKQESATELANRIQTIRGKWEPQLQDLVKRISESFSRAFEGIGCAGEVKISVDESDYANWGIDILVKFRDNEKLNALDGHRQSGGERAVSTILYLMSLQSLSSTPFRVVDEINQGMDPRNERMVHREMVRAACKAGTSQYFLITPKLLPDLEYHERMRVLCVYNGPWSLEKIDLRAHLKAKKKRLDA